MNKDEVLKTLAVINDDIIKDKLMNRLLIQVISLVETIDEQPEIIMCKDCKYHLANNGCLNLSKYVMSNLESDFLIVTPNTFSCNSGEK